MFVSCGARVGLLASKFVPLLRCWSPGLSPGRGRPLRSLDYLAFVAATLLLPCLRSRARRIWRLASTLVLVGYMATVAGAQGPVDAAIRGQVVGVCGPYPHLCFLRGVRVELSSSERSSKRVLDADERGEFLLDRLPPGEYTLLATLRGIKTTGVITLNGGELADVAVTLGPGGTVKVQPQGGESSLLEVQDQASVLPEPSRRWEDLGELDSQAAVAAEVPQSASAPADDDHEEDAASRTSGRDGSAASGLSYAGISPIQSSQTVDGLSVEQNFRAGPRGSATGGPSSESSFSEGAVRSLRVLPHTFSAQYGGGGGGLAAVSRSGTNTPHGSAFVLTRESAWAATNPFSIETHYRDGVVTTAAVKPAGSMEQFGGSVGGPLRLSRLHVGTSHKLWGFASIEEQVHADHIVSTPATPSFYALSADQIDLLANRGVDAAATNAALDYLDSLTGTTERTAYRLQVFGRVDTEATSRDRVALSYAANRFDSPAGVALGQASDAVVARGRGSLGDSEIQVDAVAARWLHTFSPRWNNEVRGQFARDLEYETPRAPLPQEPAIGPGGYAPQVLIAPNGFAYGTPSSLARSAAGGRRAYPDEARLQVADAMQIKLRKHLITLGGDWSRIHDRIDALSNAEGSFSYDSGATGGKDGGLVDWVTDYTFNVHAYPNGGCPSIVAAVHDFCFRSFTQSFGSAPTEFVTHAIAGYAEDAFRVRSDLSLTVGVRYEYTLLPPPQTGNPNLDADITATIIPVWGKVAGLTSRFPEDRNNFGPRLSAAWTPRWRDGVLGTIHVGYGMFFGRVPGATMRAALTDTALPSTTLRVRIRPTTETLCPQVTDVQQGFGYPCDYITTPPAAVAQTSSAVVFASDYRVPVVQRATLLLEREVGQRTLLRLSYVTALATQLPGSTDINITPSPGYASYMLQGGEGHVGLQDGETFVVPVYKQRLLSDYGPLTALVSNSNATYHAATAEAQLRGFHRRGLTSLELRGSYTFSRAIDYGPQSSAAPGADTQFDPFTHGYDKGLSNQQFPHRFAGDLIYKTSLALGPEWARKALSEWRLAAIGVAGSGSPYSYQIFGGTYLSGGRETINGSGGATYLPTIGRNTLRLPARGRLDLRIGREFGVPWKVGASRVKINAFAAAFNLLNTVNLSSVETRAFVLGTPAYAGAPTPLVFQDATTIAQEGLTTTPAFGMPRSSTTGISRERQVELGVRVQF